MVAVRPSAVDAGSHRPPDVAVGRVRPDWFDWADGVGWRAELDDAAARWLPGGLAVLETAGLDRCEAGPELAAAAVGEWPGVAGAVAGLNVATESIAPATRQTARMLASSGMTVPCPAKGDASRRSRLRRRLVRSSR
jgi:hypothetical protein